MLPSTKAAPEDASRTRFAHEAFIGLLTGAGLPEDYARFLASIFYPVRQGWTSIVTGDVEALTGKAPRSLAESLVRVPSTANDHSCILGADDLANSRLLKALGP